MRQSNALVTAPGEPRASQPSLQNEAPSVRDRVNLH